MNIKIVDAGKKYKGKEVLSLDELNFKEGYIYALMGLNGSGKTTLLQCTSGLDTFTKGKVFYDGCLDVPDYLFNIPALGIGFGESIIYTPDDLTFNFVGEKVVSDIDLSIRNEIGGIVDFNGIPFEVTLKFC